MRKRVASIRLSNGQTVTGLEQTSRAAAAAFHQKPWLKFVLKGQIWVKDGLVVTEETEGANPVAVEIDHEMRVDPGNIKAKHNNLIQAIRDRISAVQKMVERVAIATGQIEGGGKQLTKEDLPDVRILTELYSELDDAMNARLVAAIMSEDGQTSWTYTDEEGRPVNLTLGLIEENIVLAESVQMAFGTWYSPTKPSQGAVTTTKQESGTTDSTSKTPAPSSSDSVTPFTSTESSETI